MEEEIEQQEDYGEVTLGKGAKQRKVPIESFVQAHYKDNRLVSIVKFEETYGVSIENPPSTGRSNQSMTLSEESLIALISTCIMYLEMSGKDMKKLLEDAAKQGSVDFSCSKELDFTKMTKK